MAAEEIVIMSCHKIDDNSYAKIPCLRFAVEGNLDGLRRLLAETSDKEGIVNYTYKKSADTPLILASRYGHASVAALLLQNGGNVAQCNINGKTALHDTAQNGNLECLEVLLKAGAHVDALKRADWTPLMLACSKSHFGIVKRLVEYGAGVKRVNKDGWNSFHIAAREGCVEVLKFLLDQDESVCRTASKNRRTPLHTAAMHDRLEAVVFLVNCCHYESNMKDSCGSTPLMDAIRFGNVDIADFLIKEHKDYIHERDCLGRHSIHLAAQSGQLVSIDYMLNSFEIDVNMKTDTNGMTPLHFAAKEGHLETIRYLISYGARTEEIDDKGRKALHFASASGQTETVTELLQRYHVMDVPDAFGVTAQGLALKSDIKAVFNQDQEQIK